MFYVEVNGKTTHRLSELIKSRMHSCDTIKIFVVIAGSVGINLVIEFKGSRGFGEYAFGTFMISGLLKDAVIAGNMFTQNATMTSK